MSRTLLAVTALIALAIPATATAAPVSFTPLGRSAALGEGGAEIAAYDAPTRRAFVTNAAANALDVYDLADPGAPARIRSVDLSSYGGGPNSVAVTRRAGGLVAVAVEAPEKTDRGSVQLFDTDGEHVDGIEAGALPDMLTFTPDGRTLLVANEGEPSETADPDGSVTIVDVRRGRLRARTATIEGVPVDGPVRDFTGSLARDAEPEYIAAPTSLRAYVTLQEVNAVGVLDVKRARFRVIRSLGFKDHGLAANAFDPSDRDGGVSLNPFARVFGQYQPDAIAAYSAGLRTYLVTANEGDARVGEEARAADLPLDPAAFPEPVRAAAQLGRLTVTNTRGDTDGDGDFDELYAFGGRSLSVLDADARLRFDTGSELESVAARLDPANFNKDNAAGSAIDNRSDNKGPEPEGLDVGRINSRTYAFLGAERSGGLYAYSLSETPGEAVFAGYINPREADLGPEGVEFVSAAKSPTGAPLVLTTNEISGTLSVFAVAEG